MEYKLRCSRVLVTGGGSGIGFAITKKLLENGCRVCITGSNAEELQKAAEEISSDNLSVLQMDVCDISQMQNKLNEAACLLGGFYDGVVNCAGVVSLKDNWNVSEAEWDNVIDTDLKAAVFIIRLAAAYMKDNNIKGNILQISSILGNRGCTINSAYTVANDAITNAVRFMGKQAAKNGLVINGVAKGITSETLSNGADKIINKQSAVGRIIEPEEIADIALFMLSDAAKICIGETILADGGFWSAW